MNDAAAASIDAPASLGDVYDELGPVLDELETQRRSVLKFLLGALVALALGTPLVFMGLVKLESMGGPFESSDGSIFAFGTIAWIAIIVLVLRALYASRKRRYIRQYKASVFGTVCARLFPQMEFKPDEGISWQEFDGTELFEHESETYYSEDRFEGMQGKTNVQLAEAIAKRRKLKVDTDGIGTREVVFFRGLFMIADFHKHFRSRIRILPEGEKKRRWRGEELVEMEDPEFEAEFVVFGTDQVDARYVLSSSMLRRILDLKRRWRTDIRLAFKESCVYMTIQHNRDWFEPSFFSSARNRLQIEEFVDELDFCLGLVDDLNLNTRIWSKR